MVEMKTEIHGLKESILDIKELLRDIKKGDRAFDGGESLVNGGERRSERSWQRSKSDMEEEGELRSWTRRVELPSFEGTVPSGWVARAENFFEVQNVSGLERLHLAFISMEGSANSWFTFCRKKERVWSSCATVRTQS